MVYHISLSLTAIDDVVKTFRQLGFRLCLCSSCILLFCFGYAYNKKKIYTYTGDEEANQLRLVGGSHSTDGLLQVSVHGVWGGVCGYHWSKANSDVACRHLFGSG